MGVVVGDPPWCWWGCRTSHRGCPWLDWCSAATDVELGWDTGQHTRQHQRLVVVGSPDEEWVHTRGGVGCGYTHLTKTHNITNTLGVDYKTRVWTVRWLLIVEIAKWAWEAELRSAAMRESTMRRLGLVELCHQMGTWEPWGQISPTTTTTTTTTTQRSTRSTQKHCHSHCHLLFLSPHYCCLDYFTKYLVLCCPRKDGAELGKSRGILAGQPPTFSLLDGWQ